MNLYKIAIWYYYGAVAAILLAVGRYMIFVFTLGRG